MLIKELLAKFHSRNTTILSFFNMVQAHKNLHKSYLNNRDKTNNSILNNYIPFYSEIENITLSKESIFHQLKEFKPNMYYENLWKEVCDRMQWQSLHTSKAQVVDIKEEHKLINPVFTQFNNTTAISGQAANS
jgi:hypothetical protein